MFRHAPTFALSAWLVACVHSAPSSSMTDYSELKAERRAVLYAHDDILVLETHDPNGLFLVPYAPYVEGNVVVLTAGMASVGGAEVRRHCFDVGSLGVPGDWTQKLAWRQRDGRLVSVGEVDRSPRAVELVAACADVR